MNRRRSLLLSLLTLLAVAVGLAAGPAQAASAPGGLAPESAVGRSAPLTSALVGSRPLESGITPRLAAHGYDRIAVATGVAAEDTGALAGRDALGRFTGAGGYGAAAEARGLSEYELATGQTVIRNQVRATSSGGGPGRYYDGLVRNADGTYTGIEVKSGSASLTASQRVFDNAVNAGGVARATLNGRPIEITSTDLVRVR